MNRNWNPPTRRLRNLCALEADEPWDRRACEVDIEDSDGFALECEGESELQGHGGFADAAFAGEDLNAIVSSIAWLFGWFEGLW
jgi:hypothetical protein